MGNKLREKVKNDTLSGANDNTLLGGAGLGQEAANDAKWNEYLRVTA